MSEQTDHFFLSRDQQADLVDLLDQVPGLCEDLAITTCRQDRLTPKAPMGSGKGDDTQPLPYNPNASDAAQHLHWQIAIWAREVCESRGIDYDGADTTPGVARWLSRHVVSLAMTEGAERAPAEIEAAIRNARRATDRPADERPRWTPERVNAARAEVYNVSGIAALAPELGKAWSGLDVKRMETLIRAQAIRPAGTCPAGALYRVGDCLDAHLAHPTRRRKLSA